MTNINSLTKEFIEYLQSKSGPSQTFTTSCKDCVFAVYNEENRQEQSGGCKLGRLEKFADDVKKRYTDGDSGQSYYIIERVCNTCRYAEWAKSRTDIVDDVKQEIQLKVDFILLSFEDDPSVAIDNIVRLAGECANQHDINPTFVLVIVKNFNINYQQLYDGLNTVLKDKNIDYKLVRITHTDTTKETCIDSNMRRCKSPHYALVDTTKEVSIPSNFISKINKLMIEELQPIVAVSAYGILFIQRSLHKFLNGNMGVCMLDKVRELAKIQQNKVSVVEWNSL